MVYHVNNIPCHVTPFPCVMPRGLLRGVFFTNACSMAALLLFLNLGIYFTPNHRNFWKFTLRDKLGHQSWRDNQCFPRCSWKHHYVLRYVRKNLLVNGSTNLSSLEFSTVSRNIHGNLLKPQLQPLTYQCPHGHTVLSLRHNMFLLRHKKKSVFYSE